MKRDQEAFRFYWDVLGDRVHFQVGLNFSPQPDDMIIVDEADYFIFSDLTAFIDKMEVAQLYASLQPLIMMISKELRGSLFKLGNSKSMIPLWTSPTR